MKQSIVTLDMEGVLTPEIWIAVAEKTKIPELRRTTRDEPDYDKLMRGRLEILARHNLKLSDIQDVIGSLNPLDGAKEFLDELRTLAQVIILSDTFEQFAAPADEAIELSDAPLPQAYRRKRSDCELPIAHRGPKRKTVAALKQLNYNVISAGDSYNDTGMLLEAHTGFLIHAPDNVKQEFPQFKAVESHSDLFAAIKSALQG